MAGVRLLIVEDNLCLAEVLSEKLRIRGFVCVNADSLKSATDILKDEDFDIMILDLGLPDGNGLEWLQTQSSMRPLPPTVILTARNALEDRVAGLDGGAEDYLVKPFEFDELLARLRVMTRRSGKVCPAVIAVGELHLDVQSRTARFGAVAMQMSGRETEILELLMRQSGVVVPRSRIETVLHGAGETCTPNAVEAAMSRLRRKIEACGGREMLHTVRGLGYLLRAHEP